MHCLLEYVFSYYVRVYFTNQSSIFLFKKQRKGCLVDMFCRHLLTELFIHGILKVLSQERTFTFYILERRGRMATIQKRQTDVRTNLSRGALPYEYKRTGIGGGIHWLAIKVLNLLPKKVAQFLFTLASDKGEETRTVSDTAATFQALEVMYTFPRKRKEGTATLSGYVWWTVLDNARSVWNRLLLVKYELRTAVLEVAERKGSVRLLSIGSGSARPVLEAIASLEQEVPIESMLLDQDPQATEFSRALAQQFNLNHTQWVTGDFFRLEQHCRSFRPDVIELVGLLDYLDRRRAVIFLKKVARVLESGGTLITGNIAPNLERPYVEKGVKWPPMVYRTEKDLEDLLLEAGFAENNIRIQREPLSIHMVAVVHKSQEDMVS